MDSMTEIETPKRTENIKTYKKFEFLRIALA